MGNSMDFTEAITQLDHETDSEAQEKFNQGKKMSVFKTVFLMKCAFIRHYFFKGKCRQGVPGLFESVNESMRPFLVFAKLWELRKEKDAK